MKYIRAILTLLLLILLLVGLNTKLGVIPPLGKLLDPFSGYLQNARDVLKSDEVTSLNLGSPVTVYYDDRFVPHIFAANEADMYFAEGYLHARERLWQMDFITRAASGRLSEVIGPNLLDMDRAARRKGLLVSAQNTIKSIQSTSPIVYKNLLSYSDGVNAYIRSLNNKQYPIEFKILDYIPEDWSPLKTVLVQKYIANTLAGYDTDIQKTKLLQHLGKIEFERLYEEPLSQYAIMIDSFQTADVSPTRKEQGSKKIASYVPKSSIKYPKEYYQPPPGYGSNSWVISKHKSASGYPILANDPHLALSLPSIWYEIQLANKEVNCYGVGVPGIPYVLIGFNENIAWGITNGSTDVKDWYALSFRNLGNEYYFLNSWRKAEKRIETFEIRGMKPFVDTVLTTEIGPVVYDPTFKYEDTASYLAVRWESNKISDDLFGFYLLNRARNYDEYRTAIQHCSCPNLNFSFASRDDIAISHQGSIPLRTSTTTGEFIVDGSHIDTFQTDCIPQQHLPYEKNPEKGFVFSANQLPVGSSYPYKLYGYYGVYRNRVIEARLQQDVKFTTADMMNLQLDNNDLFASEALPVMLKNINYQSLSKSEKDLIDTLRSWNYKSDRNKTAPIIFEEWWEHFYNETWDEITSLSEQCPLPSPSKTIQLLNTNSKSKYFDIQSTKETEDASNVLIHALQEVCTAYSTYQKRHGGQGSWGNAKGTTFLHLSSLQCFSNNNIFCDGSKRTVNASSQNWGAGWRMIVEFGKSSPQAWVVHPGGQSGRPGDTSYGTEIAAWADGKYYRVSFLSPQDLINNKYMTLKLQ